MLILHRTKKETMQDEIYDLLRTTDRDNVLLALELNNSIGSNLYLKGVYSLIKRQKPIQFHRLYNSLLKNIKYEIDCPDTIFEIALTLSSDMKSYSVPYIEEPILNDRISSNKNIYQSLESLGYTFKEYLEIRREEHKKSALLSYELEYRFLRWARTSYLVKC